MIESQQLDNPAESLDSDCGTEIKVILCLVMFINFLLWQDSIVFFEPDY